MRKMVLAALAATMLCGSGHSAVIYSEAVSGDFAGSPPVFVGVLGLGSNFVNGSLMNGDDEDSFSFNVAAGQSLDHIYLSFVSTTASAFNAFLSRDGASTVLRSRNVRNDNYTQGSDFLASSLTPGGYNFDLRAFGDSFSADSYSFDFEVSSTTPASTPGSVPEPSSWAMMVVGFGLLGAAMRRRKVAVSFA